MNQSISGVFSIIQLFLQNKNFEFYTADSQKRNKIKEVFRSY